MWSTVLYWFCRGASYSNTPCIITADTINRLQRPTTTNVQSTPNLQTKGPDEGSYDEFPIIITKPSGEAGQRHHAFKLRTRTGPDGQPMLVNPYDENQFPRPLRLFRRYGTGSIKENREKKVYKIGARKDGKRCV